MPLRIVQSKQNARLKELKRVLSQPGRKATGLAGIEGPNLLEEALRAGLRVKCVFAGDGFQNWVAGLPLPPETEVLVTPGGILASILTTETPQPVAALVEPPQWTWDHVLGLHRNAVPLILVLAGLQDPGNLGTILRSAEAFGATGVVALPGTVSPWNPKAVRASAGSVFRVPIVAATAEDAIPRMHAAGLTIYASLSRGAENAHQANLARPTALIIGNEGNGVPGSLAARADSTISIPCPGPVESLNAAVAASVLLYEAARQRAAQSTAQRTMRGAR